MGYVSKKQALNKKGKLKKGYRFVKGARVVTSKDEALGGLSGAKKGKSTRKRR